MCSYYVPVVLVQKGGMVTTYYSTVIKGGMVTRLINTMFIMKQDFKYHTDNMQPENNVQSWLDPPGVRFTSYIYK